MRVHIHDVLAHIAQASCGYTGINVVRALETYQSHGAALLRLSITTDVELSELDFMRRYGKGATLYFSLVDFDHGMQLANDLFSSVRGIESHIPVLERTGFGPDDKLYLFIHIDSASVEFRDASTPSLKRSDD